jgi:2',3'-cyclic-nucleotide 2'-phosphodiesterase (5'-nucleotidase family)
MRFNLVFLFLLSVFFFCATPASARWDLVILTTSGLNGQLLPAKEKNENENENMVRTFGGFARIQSIFESYREKHPGICLTVATGDDLMGESLTNNQGQTVFGTMNKMGFDVSTLGNHEFDRGTNFLVRCLKKKKFPTVISNLNLSKSNNLLNYIQKDIIVEKNFLRIGIMGMISPDLNMISNPGPGISVSPDLIQSAKQTALALKARKTDLIVLLSHLEAADQQLILESIPEIDIVCGGQSHQDILPGQEIIARDAYSPGLMVQCGTNGRYIGVLKLKMKNGIIDRHEWTIIPITDQIQPDTQVKSFIDSQMQGEQASEIISNSPIELDTRVSLIRTAEAPIGKLVSSIMRNKFNTDIAFQNSGGIRGDKVIPPGPITGKTINNMFPFGNTMTILKVSGAELKHILERSVHKLPAASGAYLQLSGVQYALDLSKTPQQLDINSHGKPDRIKTPGNRIQWIKVMDKSGLYRPLRSNKKYTIATNSYLAKGGDGYIMLKDAPGKVETFIKVRDVIKFGLLDMQEIKINNKPYVFDTNGMPFNN